MAHHMYFSEARIELQREIRKHPTLVAMLMEQPDTTFEVRLALVAKFCGILLDGNYDQQDIDNISDLCLTELRKRSTLILPASMH